jgi:predicted phage terminase large subunit-like protein
MSYSNEYKDVLRVALLKNYSFFCRFFHKKKTNQSYQIGKHHIKIFEALKRVVDGKTTRLIINIAPRYGKTEICVKKFIAYGLALNPASKFIHLSYSDTLALDNSEEAKDYVNSEVYKDLFPYVKVKSDSKAKDKWYTTEGGGVLARSSAGQVTGFGAGAVEHKEFSGAIIIDDPIKPDDAISETLRDKINNKFETTIRSRINSIETPIIIIMQRLHENDLSGYLVGVEPGEWEVLSIPVIDNGEPIWDGKHNLEFLEKLRKINPYVFETQYMQNPMPLEGLLFPEKELKLFSKTDQLPNEDAGCVYVDVADEGGDFLCAVLCKLIGEKVYIFDVVYNKENMDANVKYVAHKINDNKITNVWVESNSMGAVFTRLLKHLCGRGKGFSNTTNKMTRILAQSDFIKSQFYFLKEDERREEYKLYMKSLFSFNKEGKNKNDDAPDATAGLAFHLQRTFRGLWKNRVTL